MPRPRQYPDDPVKQRIFNSFRSIRQCVRNPNNEVYQRSLRAGVPLKMDWDCFEDFYSWVLERLGPPTSPGARIVRRDQRRGFTRGNLEWGTHHDQGQRYRGTIQIRYQGRSQCLKSWATELGLSAHTLYGRWHRGLKEPQKLFARPRGGQQ